MIQQSYCAFFSHSPIVHSW